MRGSWQTPPIRDERQLRGQLEDQRRKQRELEEGDVLIEHPRRLFIRSAGGISYQLSVTDDGYITLTDKDGVVRIMNQGIQGERGPQGLRGLPGLDSDAVATEGFGLIDVTAGAILGGHRAVYVGDDGLAYYAQPDGLAVRTIGVTVGAVLLGQVASVRIEGEIVELSWNWGPGPVWLAADGALTQVVPTVGALFQVGTAMGPTKLRIEPQLIALL